MENKLHVLSYYRAVQMHLLFCLTPCRLCKRRHLNVSGHPHQVLREHVLYLMSLF